MTSLRPFPTALRRLGAFAVSAAPCVAIIMWCTGSLPVTAAGGGPITLYWADSACRPVASRPMGLLYPPEVLARLTADRPPQAVSTRVRDAIRNRTPIVVMWTLPPTPYGTFPRPYRIAIIDPGGDIHAEHVAPLWSGGEAGDLEQLDRSSGFADVGVVAAFPLAEFRRGRLVQIVSGPQGTDGERARRSQGWALIEWDGVARSK